MGGKDWNRLVRLEPTLTLPSYTCSSMSLNFDSKSISVGFNWNHQPPGFVPTAATSCCIPNFEGDLSNLIHRGFIGLGNRQTSPIVSSPWTGTPHRKRRVPFSADTLDRAVISVRQEVLLVVNTKPWPAANFRAPCSATSRTRKGHSCGGKARGDPSQFYAKAS